MFDTIRLTDICDRFMVQIIPITVLDEGRLCCAVIHFIQGAAKVRSPHILWKNIVLRAQKVVR